MMISTYCSGRGGREGLLNEGKDVLCSLRGQHHHDDDRDDKCDHDGGNDRLMRWRSLKRSSATAASTTATLPLTRWTFFHDCDRFHDDRAHDDCDQLLQHCHYTRLTFLSLYYLSIITIIIQLLVKF